jgi:Tol biopolymer transport system component
VSIDDRLKGALGRLAPADPSGAYDKVVEKHVRRRVLRKAQASVLVVAVVVGSAFGFYGLSRAFRTGPSHVAATASNGRIAFSNYAVGPGGMPDDWSGWRLFTMNPDGADVHEIGPEGIEEALHPSYSPDGTRIAFAGYVSKDEKGLYVVNADGGDVTHLLTPGGGESVYDLASSPDGSKIGYVIQEQVQIGPTPEAGAPNYDLNYYLWVMNADGSNPTQLTTVGREFSFSWSPRSTQIVFERYAPINGPKDTGGGKQIGFASDLYVINVDDGTETQLTHDGDAADPSWSPDGSQIAFVGTDDSNTPAVFVMNSDGSGRTQLTSDPGNEYGPVWSPDGSRIAYATREADPGYDESVCHIRSMASDGSDQRSLIAAPGSEGCPGQGGISWGVAAESTTAAPTPSPSETPTSEPTPTETTEPGTDLGLGFPVCNVTALNHIDFLGDGADGTAWTYAKQEVDGGCPSRNYGRFFLAVDFTGDGLADDSWGPFEYCGECRPFGALDLDADGADELAVLAQWGSTPQYLLFAVRPNAEGTPSLRPISVAAPGAPAAELAPGEPLDFWTGGDEGFQGAVACEGYPEHPVLVIAWSRHPIEGAGADVNDAHITRLSLESDGLLQVLSQANFTQPVAQPLPPPFGSDSRACGLNFNRI